MSLRRTTGGLLSAAGLALAALCAAPEPPHWGAFVVSLAVLSFGLFLLRQGGKDRNGGAAAVAADSQQWAQRLHEVAVRLEDLVEGRLSAETVGELDRLRLEVFVPFAEMREKLATALGLQGYADVMIAFARSERALSRSFSALVDGYPDEARAALQEASQFLRRTGDLLVAAS